MSLGGRCGIMAAAQMSGMFLISKRNQTEMHSVCRRLTSSVCPSPGLLTTVSLECSFPCQPKSLNWGGEGGVVRSYVKTSVVLEVILDLRRSLSAVSGEKRNRDTGMHQDAG